ncbi:hypothetical protein [Ruegeria sp. HKCCE3926]|uniref:hypothetical protein n=1 Tax=Ruegeria sp. HKCCE3926 TaxID=2794831 RepID=UPI001AE5E178|nr:hypothetical protein [Ruegeria sp. HKCCE3926]
MDMLYIGFALGIGCVWAFRWYNKKCKRDEIAKLVFGTSDASGPFDHKEWKEYERRCKEAGCW